MERKTCNKCLIEKDISNFHKGKTKDGYQYTCNQCKVDYANENKDNENKRKNRWKLDNIEKVKVSKKKYYDNNKEKENRPNF